MRAALVGLVIVALAVPIGTVHAQSANEQPTGTTAPPGAPASPAPVAAGQPQLSAAQLDQLVAPIALYPDELLSDVLMASTYPIEIVEADRWYQGSKNLKGVALTQALDQQAWHMSVKSLIATPTVLDMMNNQLGWTQELGNAVIAQQADVMAAVQRLRAQAKAAKTLESTKEQTVSVQTQNAKQVIVIEPAVPGTIYVPWYNPAVVYGAWAYPAYLPYYWPPPAGYVLGAGLAFGVGFAIGDAAWHGYWGGYWGGFDWGHGNINIHQTVNINGNVHVNVNSWQHNGNDHNTDFNNTFHGNDNTFSDEARNDFNNDFRDSDDANRGGADGNRDGDNRGDGGGARADAGGGGDGFRDGGGDDFHGDAFGGYGGYRSDFGGGGFRGGDWGGGGFHGGGGGGGHRR